MPSLSPLIERASPAGTFSGTPPPELPAENGTHVWRAAVVTPCFTFCFVALRLYTRAYVLKKKFTLDDYVVAATMVILIAYSALMAQATYNGMGLHIWQFDAELNSRYYLWVGITSEFYVAGLCGFKCALLLLYIRLFGVSERFKWTCYGTMFFCVGYLFCNSMTEFFGCHPIEKKWLPGLPGKCLNTVAAASFFGACNMATDLVIAILPLVVVWRLQFPTKRQKVGLSLVLSCGFLSWAVAVARWAIGMYNMQTYDRPWWAGISFAGSILELNTGLICACVATLNPIWKKAYRQVKDWCGFHSSSSSNDVSPWSSWLRGYTPSYSLHGNEKKGRRNDAARPSPSIVIDDRWVPAPDPTHIRSHSAMPSNRHEDDYRLLDLPGSQHLSSEEDESERSTYAYMPRTYSRSLT
ncbi:hypothetical protein F4779DRAFT_337953 [Xylariaceae sp. FL0662B]|nr:hypothetical protein F4779DRAFT_337953 [Xylariaceae sp. FL0662B]